MNPFQTQNHIDLVYKAIDALVEIEPIVGSPVVAPILALLNRRVLRWQDELEEALPSRLSELDPIAEFNAEVEK